LAGEALSVELVLADSAEAWARAGRPFHWLVSAGAETVMLSVAPAPHGRPLGDALRSLAPHDCEARHHMLVCARPIAGEALWRGGRLTLRLRDPAILRRLRRAPPAVVRRSVSAGMRTVWADSVALTLAP
jgi:hypothetical protein